MTNTQPLVSVAIPCYNSADTLPLALASLLAQTHTNWECIIVDDGSTDNPKTIVDTISDDRINFIRFETNKGRGAARQKALDVAQGKYLCMIDADDWIYPWKLERQVEIMEQNPDLSILSTGMAILDGDNNVVGIRKAGASERILTIYAPLERPDFPPIAHGPSIIRLDIAKTYRYQEEFRLSQDVDFLLKIVLIHPFGAIEDVTYAYTEIQSVSLNKLNSAYKHSKQILLRYSAQYRFWVYRKIVLLTIKHFIYIVGFKLGLGQTLIKRRSQKPTTNDIEKHKHAKNQVNKIGYKFFKNTSCVYQFKSTRDN